MFEPHIKALKYSLNLSKSCLGGAYYELGVYKGQSAQIILNFLNSNNINSPFRLFDTFEGIPRDLCDWEYDLKSEWERPRFVDTSLEAVKKILGDSAQLSFYKGKIQDTFKTLEAENLSFVCIDLDLRKSYETALEYTYPLMLPGAIYYFDDYNESSCPGATKAVNDFKSEHELIDLGNSIFQKP